MFGLVNHLSMNDFKISLLDSLIFAYTILTLVFDIYSWVWAIILGLIGWLIYYLSYEKGAWLG